MEVLPQGEPCLKVLRARSRKSVVFRHSLQLPAHQDHCLSATGSRDYGGNSLRMFDIRARDQSVCHEIHIHNPAVLGAWVGTRDW